MFVTVDRNKTMVYNDTIYSNGENMKDIEEISKMLKNLKSETEIYNFMLELFTKAELSTLSKRWRILNMLNQGVTQREIAKELNVSLCKVTRGSKIIKDRNAVITKYLTKGI